MTNSPSLNRIIEILGHLVSFDTTSSKSNLALINYVADFLKVIGIQSTLVFDETGQKSGLIATIGAAESSGIILSGHTDVVPVTGQSWSSDPFVLSVRGEKIYGRGTTDMKGFLACALALVEDIVKTGGDKSLTRPIHLAFSYDEEIGCLGAAPLVNEFKNLGLKANFAVIGEPTEMKVANAHKGINSFYTNIEGKEAHSSLEHLGVNAIMIAARLVNFIESMQDSAKNRTEAIDSRFTPAYTTFNVGVIEGGTANNIIAQACKFVWEFRPTPAENTAEIKQKFDEFCTKLESEARLKNTSSRIENIVRSSVPGLIADSSENHLSIAMKIAETNVLKAVPFCTEAGIFHNSGIPSVVIGPGSIEQAHQPDEFIEIKQLEQAISFMTNLRNYCCS